MHVCSFRRIHVLAHILNLLLEFVDSVLIFFPLLFEASQLSPQTNLDGRVLIDDFLHASVRPGAGAVAQGAPA